MDPHYSLRMRDYLRTPSAPNEAFDSFIEAVRPFHRLIYMIAFAGTKNRVAAEHIAMETFSTAFKFWRCERWEPEELKFRLIRTALSEAGKYIDGEVVEDIRENIVDLVMSPTPNGWRPLAGNTIPAEVIQSLLVRAIKELSPVTAVTLLLHDAFHLSLLQTSRLTGESKQKVRTRLRIWPLRTLHQACRSIFRPG